MHFHPTKYNTFQPALCSVSVVNKVNVNSHLCGWYFLSSVGYVTQINSALISKTALTIANKTKYLLNRMGRDQMPTIVQTTFSNIYPCVKSVVFWLNFHINLFPRTQYTSIQHRFRLQFAAQEKTSHHHILSQRSCLSGYTGLTPSVRPPVCPSVRHVCRARVTQIQRKRWRWGAYHFQVNRSRPHGSF